MNDRSKMSDEASCAPERNTPLEPGPAPPMTPERIAEWRKKFANLQSVKCPLSPTEAALAEALDEIERLRAGEPQWQPIETAPRDGTRVFCFRKMHANYPDVFAVCSCYFDGPFGGWPLTFEPTHWMPLPSPPRAQEDGR